MIKKLLVNVFVFCLFSITQLHAETYFELYSFQDLQSDGVVLAEDCYNCNSANSCSGYYNQGSDYRNEIFLMDGDVVVTSKRSESTPRIYVCNYSSQFFSSASPCPVNSYGTGSCQSCPEGGKSDSMNNFSQHECYKTDDSDSTGSFSYSTKCYYR